MQRAVCFSLCSNVFEIHEDELDETIQALLFCSEMQWHLVLVEDRLCIPDGVWQKRAAVVPLWFSKVSRTRLAHQSCVHYHPQLKRSNKM